MDNGMAQFYRRCYPSGYLYGVARENIAYVKKAKPCPGFSDPKRPFAWLAANQALNAFFLERNIRAALRAREEQ